MGSGATEPPATMNGSTGPDAGTPRASQGGPGEQMPPTNPPAVDAKLPPSSPPDAKLAVDATATPDARPADMGRSETVDLSAYHECSQDPAQLEPSTCGASFQHDPKVVCATCRIAGSTSQALGCYFQKQPVQRFVYLCVRQCSECPR